MVLYLSYSNYINFRGVGYSTTQQCPKTTRNSLTTTQQSHYNHLQQMFFLENIGMLLSGGFTVVLSVHVRQTLSTKCQYLSSNGNCLGGKIPSGCLQIISWKKKTLNNVKHNNIYQTTSTAWAAEIERNARLDLCGLFPSWTEMSATQHILKLLISYCGAEDYHELVFRGTAASSPVLVHKDETKTSLLLITVKEQLFQNFILNLGRSMRHVRKTLVLFKTQNMMHIKCSLSIMLHSK